MQGSGAADRLARAREALTAAEAGVRAGVRVEAGVEAASEGAPPAAALGEPETRADAQAEGRAHAVALRLLEHRQHTRAELSAALARRDLTGPPVQAALDRLAGAGLVDDEAFAAAWVADRQPRKGLSRGALAGELRRRGVGEEEIAAALAWVSEAGEREAALALVAARCRRLPPGLAAPARHRRLTAMLGRRGYPPALAERLVEEALRQG